MGIAAVPRYLGQNFTGTPPGHRFGLYFDAWDQQWKIPDSEKREALKRVTTLNDATRTLLNGLRNRQKALADDLGDSVWRLPAKSTAPFMTGLGNEHPLENGESAVHADEKHHLDPCRDLPHAPVRHEPHRKPHEGGHRERGGKPPGDEGQHVHGEHGRGSA